MPAEYESVIIGAGPAGLTAGIYMCCFKLKHIVIGALPGGQMVGAPDILNYPGFEDISGPKLTEQMVNQLQKMGGELLVESIVAIKKFEDGFEVSTAEGKTFTAKTIILATGVERRKLGVVGEIEYTGRGVLYCATCDRLDYDGKVVAVVGGANAAAQSAMQLSHAAKKVYILYRGDELRCDPLWLSQIQKTQNIEFVPHVIVSKICGDGRKLTHVRLSQAQPQSSNPDLRDLPVERLFIEIGGVPGTALLLPLGMKVDAGGYIDVDDSLATSIPGIFACGDVISHKYSIEQISSSVGTGARAAMSVFSYLKKQKAPSLWGKAQIRRPEHV